jgi:cellulose synthase/poly-beta-1,6-N-acetylglucosamine synthase-like glycosyltransferase
MVELVIRIIEKLFIIYFAGYFLFDLLLFFIFLITFRTEKEKSKLVLNHEEEFNNHKVSVIVPAYNEEVSIVQCVKMLINLDYPDYEVIVINDGSKDNTLKKLLNALKLKQVELNQNNFINTKEIRSVKKSTDQKITVIDKENGGKADSINTGINYSSGELICTIDADSILDTSSLKKVVVPLINDSKVFVSGGQLAISNDTVIENNKVISSKMPGNYWVLWQIVEYIKSFMVSRVSLSKLNALLIMSGAFSVFRRKDLLKIGGFLTVINKHKYIEDNSGVDNTTVGEEMEIVVRLWRYYLENKKKAKAVYMPLPICWTEVPDNYKNIFKQRARWHLGLAESLSIHKKLLFDLKYRATGLLAMPYYIFFELFSPLIKLLVIIYLIVISFMGLINTQWVLLMFLLITITAALLTSFLTVYIEQWSQKLAKRNREALRYKTLLDWIKLLTASIIGDFIYSTVKMFAQLKGLVDYFRKKNEWNKFERKGVKNLR